MRKILILITSLLLIDITACLYSCQIGCGGSSGNYCYSLKDVSLSAYGYSSTPLKQGEQVKWSELRLGLGLSYSSNMCRKPSTFNPLVNAAYACDPVINFRYTDSVTAISIFSDHDFDASHKAGHILNDYFSGTDIEQFNKSYGDDSIIFILKHMPAATGTHTLSVNLEFSNGVIRKVEAIPVNIEK
ncbi:MAG: hypothetical protein H6550_09340 [Chitinophagales bacterium]|nr:hypothetical protein [Chitinophagales bacterium]